MSEVISCNMKLEIGKVYPVEHKVSGDNARCFVIKEATKEEYLEDRKGQDYTILDYFYWVSLD